MIQQINLLESTLKKMESKGEVRPFLSDSLRLIDQISGEIKGIKENKIKEDISPSEVFDFYHLSLVSSIVLDSMKERLEQSEEAHDNPVSALESLRVLPNLKEVAMKLQLKRTDGTFIDIAGCLQLNAYLNNLFKLNRKKSKEIEKTFNSVANNISISQQDG